MIKSKLKKRAASLAISAAMLAACVPAGAYAADGTVEMTKYQIGNIVYYYAAQQGSTYTADGTNVTEKVQEIDNSGVVYYSEDPGTTLYGSASMSYLEYWEGENIEKGTKSEAKGTSLDTEKTDDLGAFDAVSRATTKHGIFRHGFQFETSVSGLAEDGSETSVDVQQDAAVSEANGKASLSAVERKDSAAGIITIADMQDSFEKNGKTYMINDYAVTGFQRIPVSVNSRDYAKAMILNKTDKGTDETKVFENVTIGGKDGAGNVVTEKTGGIKELEADGTYGPAAAGKATEGEIAADTEKIKYEYNTKYGDYADAYIYLKHADGTAMSTAEFLKYASSYLTAEYEYYGSTNPEENTSAKPLAVYGTKNAADTWWSANHGVRIDAGFNFDSLRLGGSGSSTTADGIENKGAAADKLGYWKVTYKAAGYNDVSAVIYLKEQYSTPAVRLSDDRKILTLKKMDDKLKAVINDKDTSVVLSKQEGTGKQAKWVKLADLENSAKGVYDLSALEMSDGVYQVDITTANYAPASIEFTLPQEEEIISLSKPSLTLYAGKSYTLTAKITPDAAEGTVAWKSSNTKVATVKDGKVTARKAGKATITAATESGKTAKCTITVKNPVLKLTKSKATIKKGKKVTIKAKATPAAKITYKSSNKKVATVNSKGVVKGKKKGTAKITVKANGISKTFKVTVK